MDEDELLNSWAHLRPYVKKRPKKSWRLPSSQYTEHCSSCPKAQNRGLFQSGFRRLKRLMSKKSPRKRKKPQKRKVPLAPRPIKVTSTTTTITTTTPISTTTTAVTTRTPDIFFTFNLPPFQWLSDSKSEETESKKSREFNDFHDFTNFHDFHDVPQLTHYRHLSYFTPAPPIYHPTTPAAQKAMMEVDFTPIFLALLPLFICVGALLGKSFGSESTTTTNSTIPNITVNVNATANSADGGAAAAADNTTNTLILFTNGTYFFPFFNPGLTTLGLGSLFGGFFPFFGFGRSFRNSFWDTGWSDLDSLYLLYESLEDVQNMLDDQERLSCFASILCSEQAKSDNRNILTFFIRLLIGLFEGFLMNISIENTLWTIKQGWKEECEIFQCYNRLSVQSLSPRTK